MTYFHKVVQHLAGRLYMDRMEIMNLGAVLMLMIKGSRRAHVEPAGRVGKATVWNEVQKEERIMPSE